MVIYVLIPASELKQPVSGGEFNACPCFVVRKLVKYRFLEKTTNASSAETNVGGIGVDQV